ncbi:hypothetical protein ACRAWF_26350 [Streptomyces sp. L7]
MAGGAVDDLGRRASRPSRTAPIPAGHTELYSTAIGWRHGQPGHEPAVDHILGERGADRRRYTRSAASSRTSSSAASRKAADAQAAGSSTARSPPSSVPQREARPGLPSPTDACVLDRSPPLAARRSPGRRSASENGTVTAGNASPLNDGAALRLTSFDEQRPRATGPSAARGLGDRVHALDPATSGLAPSRP